MADQAHARARELYKYAHKVASDRRPLAKVSGSQEKYEERLQATVEQLEAQLRSEQQKLKLKEERANQSLLISIDSQSEDPNTLLRQRRVIAAAYRRLASSKPTDLPHPKKSALPALLALRAASETTSEIRALVPSANDNLGSAREQLRAESKRLNAFTVLGQMLEARIAELEAERESRAARSVEDIARDYIAELEARAGGFHEEAQTLGDDLKWFIKAHLAPMLAAEAEGGPPVGDLLEVTDEMLGAGFSDTTRKPKPIKEGDDLREFARRGREIRRGVFDELRRLLQDLLNAATGEGDEERLEDDAMQEDGAETEGGGKENNNTDNATTSPADAEDGIPSKGWVQVREDSKAAQYLITARVAMFHPTDARKIRLLDFAG